MKQRQRHIVAIGGGGFSSEPKNTTIDDYVMRLTGKRRPRVCFVPTASGDAEGYIKRFYRRMSEDRCRPSHLSLFKNNIAEPAEHLLAQDIIYVGGGNTANMLELWRMHGIDRILPKAWRQGVVLAGVSAGGSCWFEGCSTDSFGPLAPLNDGLGILTGSFCPHYHGEELRQATFQKMVAGGKLPAGYAVDDYAALHFEGTRLKAMIRSRRTAQAYRVDRVGRRTVETVVDS